MLNEWSNFVEITCLFCIIFLIIKESLILQATIWRMRKMPQSLATVQNLHRRALNVWRWNHRWRGTVKLRHITWTSPRAAWRPGVRAWAARRRAPTSAQTRTAHHGTARNLQTRRSHHPPAEGRRTRMTLGKILWSVLMAIISRQPWAFKFAVLKTKLFHLFVYWLWRTGRCRAVDKLTTIFGH